MNFQKTFILYNDFKEDAQSQRWDTEFAEDKILLDLKFDDFIEE
jgi:hypothetical protein